ncbi:DnaD domain-containing protein [Ectobacillus polymachus]|uniref:DnaD domain-containing protein n=1 Tax=Ectobacillus polymachus TaxID=1508806 RepID=UPI003A8AC59B
MAVYRLVRVNFWQDDFVLDLTPEERHFYLYLLTCSKTTQCGIYTLPARVVELETGYNGETVDKLLQRFIDYGKIMYDAETTEVYILNWVRYNSITNVNVEKCVLRELKTVKNKMFVQLFLKRCLEEELRIPLLLAQFGHPFEESVEVPSESPSPETNVATKDDVFSFYEQNFKKLSPYSMKELTRWIKALSEELVLKALQIAYEYNKRSLAYVKGILRDWQGKGFTSVQEVEQAQDKFRKKILLEDETDRIIEEHKQWDKNALSEEELQQFLKDRSWKE